MHVRLSTLVPPGQNLLRTGLGLVSVRVRVIRVVPVVLVPVLLVLELRVPVVLLLDLDLTYLLSTLSSSGPMFIAISTSWTLSVYCSISRFIS